MDNRMWREQLNPYKLVVEELKLKFTHLIMDYRDRGLYSPIERVEGRVKTITSILEKSKRKDIPLDELETRMDDLAGIRIICQFVEDIYKVVELIRQREDMEIRYEKDYIKNKKESGYRSYHIIIYYTIHLLDGPKKVQAEIQIRTLAMNFWATVEHSLQYKYRKNIPEHITERLNNAANAVIHLDEEMSSVRSVIMEAEQIAGERANESPELM